MKSAIQVVYRHDDITIEDYVVQVVFMFREGVSGALESISRASCHLYVTLSGKIRIIYDFEI